jgi:multisubunit Na+/H+ antiporter MnhG subunit
VNRVEVLEVTQFGKTTTLVNPDTSTSLLNDRPPLLLRAIVNADNGVAYPVTVIVNHLRSMSGVNDTGPGPSGWPTEGARVRAKRGEQAMFLANLIQTRQAANPSERIVVLGDFNAHEFNDGYVDVMGILRGNAAAASSVIADYVSPITQALTDSASLIANSTEKYSEVSTGSAQSLTHILVNAPVVAAAPSIRVEHARINADFGVHNYGVAGNAIRISSRDPIRVAIATAPPISVNPATLANGTVGVSYSETLSASGGTGAYGFAVTSGALPGGLTLAANGAITGTPNTVGPFNFTITATDSSPAPGPFSGSRAYTVNIAQGTQTVTFAPASPVVFGVTPITLTATATSGLTAFTFSTSSANTICTVTGNQLTIVGVGTCALTATQPGNANYATASANANVVIDPASQTVTFAPASPVNVGAAPITLTATATSGLSAFTFSTSSASTICTVVGNQLTIVGVGTCALTATQPGDANYASASASANVVINVVAPGAPTGVSAVAGNSQATISFTPPIFAGGAPITSYSVSCTPSAAAPTTGGASPIVVTGLTNGVTYSCTVVATNSAGNSVPSSPAQVTPTFRSYVAPAATGTGTISASFTGGGDTCNFSVARYITLEGHAASPPAGSAPAGISFPHGLFDFTTTGCTPGATIAMTIVYPQPLPPGTQYWKYGPTPTNASPNWYVLPATFSGNTVTFSITDGQLGDDDLQANGTIVDQGGLGVPPAMPVPIAAPWYWALLLFMAIVGVGRSRGSRP